MSIIDKFISLVKIIKTDGMKRLIVILVDRYKIPIHLSATYRWEAGISSQIRFWDQWFSTKGLRWSEEYKRRLDPNLPLQSRPASLIPNHSIVSILDVGAGPLTVLGKVVEDKEIKINAIDPLASEYDKLLEKYQIQPIIRTQPGDAEKLNEIFNDNSFDLVYSSNAIDHSYDPESAIINMIEITKPHCYVLMEHRINEAENQNYSGFHQWNFSLSKEGDFIISNRKTSVNMTKKYADICTITSEQDNHTIINRILKH